MIIGIMGKAGSGKDTTGLSIKELLINCGVKAKRFAFADAVKDVAACLTGNKRELFDNQSFKKRSYFSLTDGFTYDISGIPYGHDVISIRELLQKVGTEAIQGTFGKNVWVNKTFSEINNDLEDGIIKVALITDVRFKHEYEAIKKMDGIIIRIVNPFINSTDTHISETDLDEYSADYTIINDWQNDPYTTNQQIHEFVQQVKRRQGHN